jgi:DNA sulfur modification protein DndD
MIFDRLILRNVGLYAGINRFELAPSASARPIILIGGLNGAGKTTLLESLQLGLYGSESPAAPRGAAAYRTHLEEMIHRGTAPEEGASIQIDFRRFVAGREEVLSLRRSWRRGEKDLIESLNVERDGNPDAFLAEHWNETMESFLPARLAQLFFFDGEQIKEMAEEDGAGEILATAIHSLLGLDLVEELCLDLQTLERRKRNEGVRDEARETAQKLERDLALAVAASEQGAQNCARLETEIALLQKDLGKLQADFRKNGGETFLRLNELTAERVAAEQEVAALEAALRELADGPAPLLLVMDQLEAVQTQATEELRDRQQQGLAEAERTRDRRIVNELAKANLSAEVKDLLATLLEKTRTRLPESRRTAILDPEPGFVERLEHLRSEVLPPLRMKISETLEALATAEERLARVERTIESVPSEDSIALLKNSLETLQAKINKLIVERSLAQEKQSLLDRESALLEARHRRFLEESVDEMTMAEETQRILEHSPKIRTTLKTFQEKVVEKHARKIEVLVLESFQQLLRKSSLVSNLKIDPATMRLRLVGSKGEDLPCRRLSAGERQLLATAILWGLARASGRPVPVIIDTPLARLDSKHRHHLVERYFPAASHQVILLSTDAEISSRYHAALKPFLSRTYHLDYDNALKRTTAQEDTYFPDYETAG